MYIGTVTHKRNEELTKVLSTGCGLDQYVNQELHKMYKESTAEQRAEYLRLLLVTVSAHHQLTQKGI